MGQIVHKCDKSGTFLDQISVHFGLTSRHVLKSDITKFRICPIWRQSDILWAKRDTGEVRRRVQYLGRQLSFYFFNVQR